MASDSNTSKESSPISSASTPADLASVAEICDRVCDEAARKQIPVAEFSSELFRRHLSTFRAPKDDHPSILTLLEMGWNDLTTICEVTDEGTERRLMQSPDGKFYYTKEHCTEGNWTVELEPISTAKARHLYALNCIPEALTRGAQFQAWASPRNELDMVLSEIEALSALLVESHARPGRQYDITGGEEKRARLRDGLAALVDDLHARARDALDIINAQ